MSIKMAQITMNAGDDIPGSVIKYNLEINSKRFDEVIVVDGNLTDEARQFYSKFPNLTVVDSPWRDSYVDQYRAWADKASLGDWVLYLDCDEIPSPELLFFLEHEMSEYTNQINEYNTLCIPCVLYLTEDGANFYPAEPWPEKEYKGQWFKNILVKKDENLEFKHFGSHVIPGHGVFEKGTYIAHPYFHMKTLESFIYNDVWQAFLHPEGQGYSSENAGLFKLFTNQYSSVKEFKEATFKGEWNVALQKFAWDRRYKAANAVSRLAWVYYILCGHQMPEADEMMTLENVKKHVLDDGKMALYKQNIEKKNVLEVK